LVVVGPVNRPDHDHQHCYHHAPKVKPEAATAVVELLMMGEGRAETCWAVNKRQVINWRDCCIICLVDLNCMMMHGLTNFKLYAVLRLNMPEAIPAIPLRLYGAVLKCAHWQLSNAGARFQLASVLYHAVNAHRESRYKALPIIKLVTMWGTHCRGPEEGLRAYGAQKNRLSPPGLEDRTVQPVVSRPHYPEPGLTKCYRHLL